MTIIKLTETDSTNRWLLDEAELYRDESITVALADFQTAGKGMGTNTWESEAGKNLLFSILIHPKEIAIREQYLLSMTEALALRDAIGECVESNDRVTIKWPNDIYIGDRKVSGTRIDLNIVGHEMRDFVIGTGINVNQKEFHSDAPNPVSMYQVSGREYSREELLTRVLSLFEHYYNILLQGDEGRERIVTAYHESLYRLKGKHKYKDESGIFEAEMVEVKPNGRLVLRRCSDEELLEYEFKEVSYII